MNAMEWLTTYAEKLGLDPPTPDEVDGLLELAAEAAHASERIAAPIACWLAARAGKAPDEALEIARTVAAES
jgi:Domain of unknown function (DUF6457)